MACGSPTPAASACRTRSQVPSGRSWTPRSSSAAPTTTARPPPLASARRHGRKRGVRAGQRAFRAERGRRDGVLPQGGRPMSGGTFDGWKGDFRGFFLGLKANNSKAYFDAHRKQYEVEIKAPMAALLAELEPDYGPARLA